jgi:hypothetical protein
MATTSLLDWILSLLRDPDAREAFQADPAGYASAHGFDNVTAGDMHDVLCLAVDDESAHGSDRNGDGGHHGSAHLPPPRHYSHHESAPQYLNHYITNNYKIIDEHDTNIDNSVHQDIDTGGGDFDQHIDNDPVVASGEGSVAAGHGIRDSTLTSGDHNVVGNDNLANTGDDSTTAFGSGDASTADVHGLRTGDGGSFSVGGDASGHSTKNDTTTLAHNSGSGSTSVNAAGDHGYTDQNADQHESDHSTHSSYQDAQHTDSHDMDDSANHSNYDDSHNYDSHTYGLHP